MKLSTELISQFAKITNDRIQPKKESVMYGQIPHRKSGTNTWWIYVYGQGTNDAIEERNTGIPASTESGGGSGSTVTPVSTIDQSNDTPDVAKEVYVHIDGSYQDNIPCLLTAYTTVDVQMGDRVIVSIRNHAAVITANLTTPSTTVRYVNTVKETITETITADFVTTGKLEASEALIRELVAEEINAQNVNIDGKLDAEVAEITYAKIEQVDANYGEFNTLKSDYAVFKETTTKELYADVAEIEKLIFGSAGGNVIQTSFANAVIAQLGEAQIKSAMIDEIVTNDVHIRSKDGRLIISDDTIQIGDSSRVRVQIGKDASGDYSMNIWDAEGNLMFSEGGITDSAIKDAIIRDDMIADEANISAGKIFVSDVNKTLDVAFTDITTEVTEMGETITSQGAEITALQNSITTKVWQQDINTATESLSTQYTELSQDVDSISTTVASHTADIAETQSLADDTHTRLTVAESLVQQLANSISMLVTDGNGSSLMTQTDEGWTFSTAEIQDMINSTSEDLHNLSEEMGATNATVDILKQGLEDLGVISEYVKIGTYEDEPCIELGEGDSDFKLLVTNTRILFMDGSDVPAYITNKSLYIKKAVIEEELHQGNWVWKARSNGNLGLQWKGSD